LLRAGDGAWVIFARTFHIFEGCVEEVSKMWWFGGVVFGFVLVIQHIMLFQITTVCMKSNILLLSKWRFHSSCFAQLRVLVVKMSLSSRCRNRVSLKIQTGDVDF